MSITCEFCKNKFKSKYTLKIHQAKTRYCLKIQGKTSFKGSFICSYCKRDFTLKSSLQDHMHICKDNTPLVQKLKEENKTLHQEIKILKTQMNILEEREKKIQKSYEKLTQTLAKRSTTTNNIVNNNINLAVFDKSNEEIKRIVEEKYNRSYFLKGQEGVARFAHSHVINPEDNVPLYQITDKTRGHGRYKKSEDEIVTDTGMMGLTNKIHPSVKEKAVAFLAQDWDEEKAESWDAFQEIMNMRKNNDKFRKAMIKLMIGETLDDEEMAEVVW